MFSQFEISIIMLIGAALLVATVAALFALMKAQRAAIRRRAMIGAHSELVAMAVKSVMTHARKASEPGYVGSDAARKLRDETLAQLDNSAATIRAQYDGPVDPVVEKFLQQTSQRIRAAAEEVFIALDEKDARRTARA